jgi:hypothetical protein
VEKNNTMRLLLTVLIILILGCKSKTSDKSDNFLGEDFNDFYNEFISDSLFQLERTRFPFVMKSWDINDKLTVDKKEKSDWRFLKFEYKEEYGKREIDAYTQEIKIYSDSAKLELRGVDNGIYIDFEFYKENGKWLLVSEKDFSN